MDSEELSPTLNHHPSVSRSRSRADTLKRVSRACLHCRQRKSKCDLYVLNCPFLLLFLLFLTLYTEIAVVARACPPVSAAFERAATASWAARIGAVAGFAKVK